MDFRNQSFRLVQNDEGHASDSTVMVFENSQQPFRATYSGPNVTFGHVLVEDMKMIYHARNTDGSLSAGIADVELDGSAMTLRWQWLTGQSNSGTSIWERIGS